MAALIVLDNLILMPKDDPRGIRLRLRVASRVRAIHRVQLACNRKGVWRGRSTWKRLEIEQDNFPVFAGKSP